MCVLVYICEVVVCLCVFVCVCVCACVCSHTLSFGLWLLRLANRTEKGKKKLDPGKARRRHRKKALSCWYKRLCYCKVAWKAGPRYRAQGEHQKRPSKQEPGPGILLPEPKNNECERRTKNSPREDPFRRP